MMLKVLDHGYIRFVEAWGHGDDGRLDCEPTFLEEEDYEIGIIEAARMSTGKNFLGWGPKPNEKAKCKSECGPFRLERGEEVCVKCEWRRAAWMMQNQPCVPGTVAGDEKLLKYLYDNRHSTPFEMAGMTIEVELPIFTIREWHRHRTQSYNEMSARYIPLPNSNYVPTVERCMMVSATNKQAGAVKGAEELTHEKVIAWLERLQKAYAVCESVYQDGLRIGIPKELARLPVPVGRYTRMRASANLRNWLAFMTLRSEKNPGAQWEIRQFANALGTIIANKFPRTWELFYGKEK